MADRKAARVFPEPVGAAISVCPPARIAGQPSRCGAVGSPSLAENHLSTAGWKGTGNVTAAILSNRNLDLVASRESGHPVVEALGLGPAWWLCYADQVRVFA